MNTAVTAASAISLPARNANPLGPGRSVCKHEDHCGNDRERRYRDDHRGREEAGPSTDPQPAAHMLILRQSR